MTQTRYIASMRMWWLAMVCLAGCDETGRRIEHELKTDRSRPGYVGVTRALEVVSHAHRAAETMECPLPLQTRGTWVSTFEASYSIRGASRRTYRTKRTYSSDGVDAWLSQQTETNDSNNIAFQRTKSWWFVGGATIVEETVSGASVAGTREPTFDERSRMMRAAASGWDFVSMFDEGRDEPCRIPERDYVPIVANVRHIETTRDERTPNSGTVLRTVSFGDGVELEIRFEYANRNEVSIPSKPVVERPQKLREPTRENEVVVELKKQGVLK